MYFQNIFFESSFLFYGLFSAGSNLAEFFFASFLLAVNFEANESRQLITRMRMECERKKQNGVRYE